MKLEPLKKYNSVDIMNEVVHRDCGKWVPSGRSIFHFVADLIDAL